MYDIYDSYKPDINNDNMPTVSSLTHYTKENNNNEILEDKSFSHGSVKSNPTINIDPMKY